MPLNRIDPRHVAPQTGIERFRDAVRSDGSPPDAGGDPARKGAGRVETLDRAEISETAHKLMEIRQDVESGRASLEALPDVRNEKLDAARERLARGYYHSPVVSGDVATKLGRTFAAIDDL